MQGDASQHDKWSSVSVSPSLGNSMLVKPSKEAMEAPILRELRSGEEFRRKAFERKREQKAYKAAAQMEGHKELLLGKCVAVFPLMEYIDQVQKRGSDEVHSKEYLQYFQKKFSHLSPHRL